MGGVGGCCGWLPHTEFSAGRELTYKAFITLSENRALYYLHLKAGIKSVGFLFLCGFFFIFFCLVFFFVVVVVAFFFWFSITWNV